jgi:GTPase SAR1 family protein
MVGSDLNAALEKLAAARGDASAYLEASKKILVQMEKLQENPERSVSISTDYHTKILQEFIFSAKCVELRTPSRIITSALNGPSKY